MSELIDNRAQRITVMKEVIQHLHSGAAPDVVRGQLRELVRQTDAAEIMSMEQELIQSGVSVEKIRSMCDLHSQVTSEILVQLPTKQSVPPGHPIDTFKRENSALTATAHTGELLLSQLERLDADANALLDGMRQVVNELLDVEKHYQRKEHALFSCLERHGVTGPSQVMWAKDDEVRELLKNAATALRQAGDSTAGMQHAASALRSAINAVKEMILKEENILFPMALQTLREEEWTEVWAASPQYGWCLVEPLSGYAPNAAAQEASLPEGTIQLPSGNVSLAQLAAVFAVLPIDLTFVDAEDRVAFFTEGPQRVFARSKAIIGRKVQNCHPPRSVDVVERILSDFRSGRQDSAEFWINFQDRFIHIRYFAVRDEAKQYLGTLEVTQDATAIRNLEGERRLLSYEGAGSGEAR